MVGMKRSMFDHKKIDQHRASLPRQERSFVIAKDQPRMGSRIMEGNAGHDSLRPQDFSENISRAREVSNTRR
jgi:hypothetical protein